MAGAVLVAALPVAVFLAVTFLAAAFFAVAFLGAAFLAAAVLAVVVFLLDGFAAALEAVFFAAVFPAGFFPVALASAVEVFDFLLTAFLLLATIHPLLARTAVVVSLGLATGNAIVDWRLAVIAFKNVMFNSDTPPAGLQRLRRSPPG